MGKFADYFFTFVHGTTTSLSVLFLLFITGSVIQSCAVIDPEKTYSVIDVTDSSGKIYKNLRGLSNNTFMDYHGNSYTFNGNFTAITRKVSGEQFLKEINQSSKPFPLESIY